MGSSDDDRLRREAGKALAGADPARVADAEVALGERAAPVEERLAAAMRTLLGQRRPESTICPSDAARLVGGAGWRELMDAARAVAGGLAGDGVVVVRQGGADVDLATVVGPIRLGRGPRW